MNIAHLDRTPSNHRDSTNGVWCMERDFKGQDGNPPVHLVVFDCDETLTISTFMPREHGFSTQIGWNEWGDYIAGVNFESPFAEGQRLDDLRDLFSRLAYGPEGPTDDGRQVRGLAVLTRNERGPVACLNLLMMAGLAKFLDAVWSMPAKYGSPSGVYKQGTEWKSFTAPVGQVFDHKADVIHNIAEVPCKWFPQLKHEGDSSRLHILHQLKVEEIVLVDDVRTNFQSPSPEQRQVLRYCKVARYDAQHPQMGLVQDMGGIGSVHLSDFSTLVKFIDQPWDFKSASSLDCMECEFEGCCEHPSATLVVFEFDETLSVCTFDFANPRFATEIGISCVPNEDKVRTVEYNFESPYIDGSRVEKLRAMLAHLADGRTLAILTENSAGAVTVLNLLMLADLADYFVAIWAPSAESGRPTGAFKKGSEWKDFTIPPSDMRSRTSRAEVFNKIVVDPKSWFPQLDELPSDLSKLTPANIVAVDDERTNFVADAEHGIGVPRYCHVARYDDVYRDQGFMVHLGGIGAKNDNDYLTLCGFVSAPWRFRVACPVHSPGKTLKAAFAVETASAESVMLERSCTDDRICKTPVERRRFSSGF
eukprot:TRINITY_DN23451_c0_g1_i1.p1 TRINITY_DN23451_c0_g1~~TRINITY_DN23451_c0_g1_i1.p1  ORF type:complete len:591 (-),score=77.00 TRINITY_DN23451_c0_g1_i1:407-2179(-)